jgi:hypothetical protein
MPQAAIDLAAGTGDSILIDTTASQHFYADEIVLVFDSPGTFAIYSGTTQIVGNIVAAAGAQYSFFGLRSRAVGDNLILNRTTSIGARGNLNYRIK